MGWLQWFSPKEAERKTIVNGNGFELVKKRQLRGLASPGRSGFRWRGQEDTRRSK